MFTAYKYSLVKFLCQVRGVNIRWKQFRNILNVIRMKKHENKQNGHQYANTCFRCSYLILYINRFVGVVGWCDGAG